MARVRKSDEEWQEQLTREQYRVTRNAGTETAYSGDLTDMKDPGEYNCVCCGANLFSSEDKFDSKTGWPSFSAAKESNINTEFDRSFGMKRMEVLCSNCDAHLGHVFDDGPNPTGMRYCINSVALEFNPDDKD